MIGHIVFDGPNRLLKFFTTVGTLAVPAAIQAHDVGILDGAEADPFGHDCKCPPGNYFVGAPQICARLNPDGTTTTLHDDDIAYGHWFTPLSDIDMVDGGFITHGRGGIGVHGGGSASPTPFAPRQGWFPTLGCIRLQNEDNDGHFIPYINRCRAFAHQNTQNPDTAVVISVYWGARGLAI